MTFYQSSHDRIAMMRSQRRISERMGAATDRRRERERDPAEAAAAVAAAAEQPFLVMNGY